MRIYNSLLEEVRQIEQMAPKYRNKAKDVETIRTEVAAAHRQHAAYLAR